MHIDKFTKSVLLVIAVSLGIIALNPWFQPTVARASATKYSHIKPIGHGVLLDTRNGNLWSGNLYSGGGCARGKQCYRIENYLGTLVDIGKPLIIKKELAK